MAWDEALQHSFIRNWRDEKAHSRLNWYGLGSRKNLVRHLGHGDGQMVYTKLCFTSFRCEKFLLHSMFFINFLSTFTYDYHNHLFLLPMFWNLKIIFSAIIPSKIELLVFFTFYYPNFQMKSYHILLGEVISPITTMVNKTV